MAVIKASELTVANRIDGVDLELKNGELVGLIGPNGAGKSTLLNVLAGVQAYSGRVRIDGEDLLDISAQHRAQRIALQPQFIDSAWSLCVADIVSFGRIPWGDMDQAIIQSAMCEAGVDALATRRIDELSGGEKARVWLARMLANRAGVLLLDEPVASLDIHYQHQVLGILQAYARRGHAVLLAIHDLSLAARYCDRLLLLDQARLIRSGTIDEVMDASVLAGVFHREIHVDLTAHPPVVLAR